MRYYDPEAGRYLTRDPIGYGDGMNVYLYVGDNPINRVDPLGLAGNVPSQAGNRYAEPAESQPNAMLIATAESLYQRAHQRLTETIASGDRPAARQARLELQRLEGIRNGPSLQRGDASPAERMESSAYSSGSAAVRALDRNNAIRSEQHARQLERMSEAERSQIPQWQGLNPKHVLQHQRGRKLMRR